MAHDLIVTDKIGVIYVGDAYDVSCSIRSRIDRINMTTFKKIICDCLR